MSPISTRMMFVHTAPATTGIARVVQTPASPAALATNHAVAAHPVVLQQATNVMTVNPAVLHWMDPIIFTRLSLPQPRSGFSLPTLISPVATPNDQTLLEEPQDATKKHYLPGYGIGTTGNGTQLMQWVSLEPIGNSYQLIVHLKENTAQSLSSGNVRIDAPTRCLLTGNLQQRAVTWDFGTATTENNTLKLTLPIADIGTRNSIYQAMTDPAAQAQLILRRSLTVGVPTPPQTGPAPVAGKPAGQPPAQLYRSTAVTIDTAISFTFSKDLDKNVFAQLDGVGGAPPAAWNIVRVNWNQRPYVYYQERNIPTNIYFLPDEFKIARDSNASHSPKLTVVTNGEDINSVTLTLSYVAQPVWSADRIAAAAAILQQQLSLTAPADLAVFDATDTALALTLPPQDPGASVASVQQPGVKIRIPYFIAGSVTLKLAQFQQIYDALFDNVSELLSGMVSVTVDQDVEAIPFTARASDFAGDIFETTTTFDPQANHVSCALRNAIESTIHVDQLGATLTRNGKNVPSTIQQISPSLPVDLVPSPNGKPANPAAGPAATPAPSPPSSLTATVQAAPDRSIDDATKVLFDFTGARVIADAKAIWQAIMQNQVVGPVTRQITIKLVAGLLAPPTAAGGTTGAAAAASSTPAANALLAVQVVFESGQTASFDGSQSADAAGFLNQTVNLAVPVAQYVLHEADTGTYRYRVVQISRGGQTKGDWIVDNTDVLFVSVG
jgi:hypothetical protein